MGIDHCNLVFNEECLVSASHQLALTTSLPFVHTAGRCSAWSAENSEALTEPVPGQVGSGRKFAEGRAGETNGAAGRDCKRDMRIDAAMKAERVLRWCADTAERLEKRGRSRGVIIRDDA